MGKRIGKGIVLAWQIILFGALGWAMAGAKLPTAKPAPAALSKR